MFDRVPLLEITDDPAPVDMLAVGPDGRRVGDDATTGRPSTRLMGPSFGPVRSWTDPWQQRAASQPSKRLAVLDPAAGTWRLVVTSRAAGPLDFAIGWSLPGVQRSLAQSPSRRSRPGGSGSTG
ncbi:MAG TPA: hypothetical protein VFC19_50025 [Candidatus Limnocylindrales bacterium]|nr:hypothetical protein [Candidatus Limnocylindrales bacterium]